MPNYPRVRDEAKKLLSKYNIVSAPIDPEAIAEAEGIDVVYADFHEDITNQISGLYDFETKTIIVNKSIPANRKTFTIAHELAHAILHEDYAKSENYIAMPRSNHHDDKPDEEHEADAFAACLLVPKEMLKKYREFASIPELAKMFAVSQDVVAVQSKYI